MEISGSHPEDVCRACMTDKNNYVLVMWYLNSIWLNRKLTECCLIQQNFILCKNQKVNVENFLVTKVANVLIYPCSKYQLSI